MAASRPWRVDRHRHRHAQPSAPGDDPAEADIAESHDWDAQHFHRAVDAGKAVELANVIVELAGRPIAWATCRCPSHAPTMPSIRLATGLAGRAFPFIRYDLGDG
jgi:hypothetical protein